MDDEGTSGQGSAGENSGFLPPEVEKALDAMNVAFTESAQVQETLAAAKNAGYKIQLAIEISHVDVATPAPDELPEPKPRVINGKVKFTNFDRRLLHECDIRLTKRRKR